MKVFLSLLLALCMIFSLSVTAFADDAIVEPVAEIENGDTVEPRAEQTEWVFRVYNGNIEKRLWSNTYGVWLTDWIILGPYTG